MFTAQRLQSACWRNHNRQPDKLSVSFAFPSEFFFFLLLFFFASPSRLASSLLLVSSASLPVLLSSSEVCLSQAELKPEQ